jgi:hypothetical protein
VLQPLALSSIPSQHRIHHVRLGEVRTWAVGWGDEGGETR